MKSNRFIMGAMGLLLAVTGMTVTEDASAVPAFARQIDNACETCHYQHFPKLKPFGRMFKANGYSISARDQIGGENPTLSLPKNLNAAFVMRSKYVDDSSEASGQWSVPEEAAILIGGRLADGIGGMVEWGGPLLSAKVSFTRDAGMARIGTTLFTTDGLGAGYGFEIMNTGAVRNHRPFEQASKATLGSNENLEIAQAATGVTLFAAASEWFVAGTMYAADSNEAGITTMDAGTNLSTYLRAAYMPTIAGLNGGFGFGVYSGTTTATMSDDTVAEFTATAGDQIDINTNAWFVDAQLEGDMGGHEVGIYFMYAEGDDPATGTNEINLYGSTNVGDDKPKGWGADIEYSMSKELHLLASAGQNDNGGAGDKTTMGVGLYWQLAQNVSLQPMYEQKSGLQGEDANGDDVSVMTITMETAF